MPALFALLGGSLFALTSFIPGISKSILDYDRKLSDSALYIPDKITPRDDLVFLGIDDQSISLQGIDPEIIKSSETLSRMSLRLPWDRRVYAETIDILIAAGAKLVIIDLLFSEESTPEADQALAEAINRHPGKVMLGCALTAYSGEHDSYMLVDPHSLFFEIDNPPIVGFVNFRPQIEDGLIRTVQYYTTLSEENGEKPVVNESTYDSLSGATIRALGKNPTHGNVQIHFARSADLNASTKIYAPISFSSIFIPHDWETRFESGKFFNDKVVLIGPAAIRLQDNHQTPVGQLFGPQVHLQAIAAGLDDQFVFRPFEKIDNIILKAGLAGSITIALIILLISRPLISFSSSFALIIISFIAAFLYARFQATWISPIAFASSMLLGTISGQSFDLLRERLERSRLHNQFRRFVSRDVADSLVNDPSIYQIAAKGRRRRVVVLFSDIRGFTSLSEKVSPEQLFAQLNEYLSAMVTIIFAHKGTLDKFIGDAILAHWGALDDGNDKEFAQNALAATNAMIAKLDQLNADWDVRKLPVLNIGVGLHIGDVLAGEIGSLQRTEFGVIGDAVNLASRLEGMTKTFSSKWLASGQFIACTGDQKNNRIIAKIRVKGRAEPVEIWSISPGIIANLQYQQILSDFEDGHFSKAEQALTEYISKNPTDSIAPHLLEHTRKFIKSPPENWDGIINFSEK
jgi:adenylate cyclase